MKKSTIKKILTIAAITCLGCVTVACGKGDGGSSPSNEVVLVGFENETISVGLGETYQLDLLGYTETGRPYGVQATVKDSEGNEVEALHGKFIVDQKEGYTITYTFGTQSRTVTLNVGANKKPVLSLEASDVLVRCNEGLYTISEATAYDYYDGNLEVEVEVFKATDNGNVSVEYDADTNQFMPTEVGEYYVIYKATNSAGNSAEWKVTVYSYGAFASGNPWDKVEVLEIDSDDYTGMYNPDVASAFVRAGSEELAGIKGDYAGAASKFRVYTNPNYRLTNYYTTKGLAEISKKYSHVSIWFAVTGITWGKVYMMNDGDSFYCKAIEGNQELTAETCGIWQRWIITFEDYIQLLQINNYQYCKLFRSWCDAYNGEAYFYIGDAEFCNYTPSVLEVDGKTANRVYMFDGVADYHFEYADAARLGFEGDYDGGAAKRAWVSNTGYRVATSYTAADVDALAEQGYDKVTLWFALGGQPHTGDQSVFVRDGGMDGKPTFVGIGAKKLGYEFFGASGLQTNNWYKLTISLDEFKSTLSDGYFNLVASWDWASGGQGCTFYIGNVYFE